MPTGERNIGEFCWINVVTPDPDAARKYFGDLFGWEYKELPGMGHIIQVDGHDVGGLWDLDGPDSPPDARPGVGVMVRVENADAISAKARSLGGDGKEAFDVGPSGRMAEIADPTGAAIDVWQGGESPGMTADPYRNGVPSWIEAATPEIGKAAAFYRDLFGWTVEENPMGVAGYTMFKNNGAPTAGMYAPTPEMGEVPPHWVSYCTVDDVDATAKLAIKAGGSLYIEPLDIPKIGRMCGIISPQGVRINAITYVPMEDEG